MTQTLRGAEAGEDLELEKRIFAKLVVRLFPLLMLSLFMAYMDRANLAVIKTPLSEDLGLSASGYGLAAGIFYLGYLFFEVPSNIALNKFGARLWIGRILLSWGFVTLLFALATGTYSLVVLRFLLGAAEAGLFPGVILYLTYWFPGRLFVRAYSTFQLAIPVALTVTTIITAAILNMDGVLGLAGWRWVFILQGAATVALGFIVFKFLPNGPKDAAWLTKEERDYIAANSQMSQGHDAHHEGAFAEVAKDRRTWIYSGLYFSLNISFWTITYWMPTLIREKLGVGPIEAGYISALPWLCLAFLMFGVGVTSARTGDRRWHIAGCSVVAFGGLIIALFSTSPVLLIAGLCAAAAGSQAVMPLFWSHTSTVFTGVLAATGIALINSVGNVSGFVGPYVQGIISDVTGDATSGLLVMSSFFLLSAVWTLILMKPHKA